MSSERLSGFSSAFDDMLERNRRELDALSGGSSRLRAPPSANQRPTPSTVRPAEDPAAPAALRTAAEAALDRKLGPGWRQEVVERVREGGEMVVRCRITAPQRGITRTVYGAAPLSGSAARTSGMVGGRAFRLGGGSAQTGAGTVHAEREAERAAVEAALAAGARLL